MPKKTFALEPNSPKRLEIQWKRGWKEIAIFLDNVQVGIIPTQNELKAGQKFSLPGGSTLTVGLDTPWLERTGFILLRDGLPLPGSATDPNRKVKFAADYIFFIACIWAGLGLLFTFAPTVEAPMGWAKILLFTPAMLYLILGLLVLHFRSPVALWVGFILFLPAAGVFLFQVFKDLHCSTGIIALFFTISVMASLYQGIRGIQELKKHPQLVSPPPPAKTLVNLLLAFIVFGLLVLAAWLMRYGSTGEATAFLDKLPKTNPFTAHDNLGLNRHRVRVLPNHH